MPEAVRQKSTGTAAVPVPMFRLNPEVVAHPFDSDAREPMILCEVPRSGGEPARVALPALLWDLLQRFDGQTATADIVGRFAAQHSNRYEEPALRRLVSQFFAARGLLLDADSSRAPAAPARRISYLFLRIPLLRAGLVQPVANALRWMYTTPVALTWLALVLVAHALFYLYVAPKNDIVMRGLGSEDVLPLTLLTLAGLVAHEFGHAAAAARFGCKRLEIGFGMYLYMPVMYTDLTDTWKLPRMQRAVVDLGGVYFQSVFVTILLGLFLLTDNRLLLYCFLVADFTVAASLNPVLRLDGYWIVSDLTGIPNLRAQSSRLLFAAWSALWNRRRPTRWPTWNLSPRATLALGIYAIVSTLFFVYLTDRMLGQFLIALFAGFPVALIALWRTIEVDPVSWSAIGVAVRGVLWRTLLLVGMGRFIWFIASSTPRYLRVLYAGLGGKS